VDRSQHQIHCYRELSEQEVDLINEIHTEGRVLNTIVDAVGNLPDSDRRAVAIARTEIQTGIMWLVRAIAKPRES